MKIKYLPFALAIVIASGCDNPDELQMKKTKLEALKKQQEDIRFQILELEKQIVALDTSALEEKRKSKLVTTLTAQKKVFSKFIDIQGVAGSDLNVAVSAEVGGEVVRLAVKEGDAVKKGDLLVQLDDALLLKEMQDLKVSLELASTVFERQEKLWEKKIGSELQYLEAKNNKESLETKLQKLQTQLDKTRIKAPVSGIAENIVIKLGEKAASGYPLLNVVNLDELKIKADVPERYISAVKAGENVTVLFPALGQERKAVISSVGNIINPRNRTFNIEIILPNKDHALKANLLAIVKIVDYQNPDAITLPTRLIQQDNGAAYVYLVAQNSDAVAKKVIVKTGETYGAETEVLSGIAAGDLVIDEGAHDVNEGSLLDIQNDVAQQ